MLKTDIGKFLACLDVEPSSVYREGWVIASCPLAPFRHKSGKDTNPSFGVRLEPGESFCNCFACGFRGSQSDLLTTFYSLLTPAERQNYAFKDAWAMVMQATEEAPLSLGDTGPDLEEALASGSPAAHVFADWWLEGFELAYAGDVVHPYLESRFVTPAVAAALDLRWDPEQERICFPVRDFDGRLRGLHGRTIHKGIDPVYRMYTFEKANNPEVWLGEHWLDPTRPVLMVESVFDLASVMRVYRNVVSPLTASLSVDKIKRMSDVLEIVTLFDADDAGRKARKLIKSTLKGSYVRHVDIDPEDGEDPGAISEPEVLAQLLGPYLELDFTLA